MGDREQPTGFGMVLDERDRILTEAIAAGCSPDGHRGIGRAAQMDGRLLGFIHAEVKATPERTVALMRSEVVTLVQAHAEDAVKRHVKRMLPDAPGSPTTPTEDRRRIPAGVWAVMAAMGRTAPWAVAATAMFGTVGWIGWLVAKGRGWL